MVFPYLVASVVKTIIEKCNDATGEVSRIAYNIYTTQINKPQINKPFSLDKHAVNSPEININDHSWELVECIGEENSS